MLVYLIRSFLGPGTVKIQFISPMQYFITNCSPWSTLPVQPPEEVDKIWTILKTITNIYVTSNGVEVLDYQFSSSGESQCVKWEGDVVTKIKFPSPDTASDSYRADPTGNGGVINS